MGAAQGILGSVNDLLIYSSAMIRSANFNRSVGAVGDSIPILKGIEKQFSGHIFTTTSLLKSSYGLGIFQHQLPGSIAGTGANGGFVKQVPQIVPEGDTRLVISHPGSLAGYTSFFAMLPEADAVVAVLNNSIGFADPSAWIGHIIIEALVESPSPVDIMKFVKKAASNHIQSYSRLQKQFDALQVNDTPPDDLTSYIGTYWYTGNLDFKILIRLQENSMLQVVFQGLESQSWDLEYLEAETFH